MRRKIFSLVLAFVLVFSIFAVMPAFAASVSTEVKTTRTGDSLYIRKGPHKGNTPTLGTVKNGTKIYWISSDNSKDPEAWSKIEVQSTGTVGYIKNKYVAYLGLDNSGGELDKDEDKGIDYSNAADNDGKKGTASPSTSAGIVVTKNGGSVNVRKTGSSSGTILGQAKDGEWLTISGSSGSWYKVKTEGGLSGYMYKDYVQKGFAARTTGSVNFRTGAGMGYSVIRVLANKTSITVLSVGSSWSYIKSGSTYGYIHNDYWK